MEVGDTALSLPTRASRYLSSRISDEVILESGMFTAALRGAGLKLLEFLEWSIDFQVESTSAGEMFR